MLSKASAMLDVLHLGNAKIIGPRHLHCSHARDKQRPVCGANLVPIKTHTLTHASSLHAPAKSQMDSDHAVRMARNHQCRRNALTSIERDLHRVRLLQLQRAHRVQAHDRRIVPAQVRHLLGQLLQPANIGEPAVIDRRIRPERNLKPTRSRQPGKKPPHSCPRHRPSP